VILYRSILLHIRFTCDFYSETFITFKR
jgi:hypothetical protein